MGDAVFGKLVHDYALFKHFLHSDGHAPFAPPPFSETPLMAFYCIFPRTP